MISSIVADHPGIHHRITGHPDDTLTAVQELASSDIDVLAINGGDGTVSQVFTVLFNNGVFRNIPRLVLLPGGTTNMNAGDIGLRGKLPKAVRHLADWSTGQGEKPRTVERAIMRIHNPRRPAPDWGMFFGTGTVTHGIDYCHRHVHTRGLTDELGPGLVLVRTLWGMLRRDPNFTTAVPARIDVDSLTCDKRQLVMLIVTSLQRLFLGIKPWWGKENGPLHASWIERPHSSLLRAAPAILRGIPNRHTSEDNGYFSHNGDSLRLWLDGVYTIDGELFESDSNAGPLAIDAGVTAQFLVPADSRAQAHA